jgi:5'(3')-deoxyribonucleotidase
MDAVLCDFEKAIEKFGYGTFDEIEEKYGEARIWKMVIHKGVSFWSEMDWMPDGKDLWKYIKKYKPIILSAPINHPTCAEGKRQWVRSNLGPYVKLILSHAKRKQEYANSNSILIDDRESNVRRWREANGIAICHTSTKRTISELKKIMGD